MGNSHGYGQPYGAGYGANYGTGYGGGGAAAGFGYGVYGYAPRHNPGNMGGRSNDWWN